MPLARTFFLGVVVAACTACTPQGQCETQLPNADDYCNPNISKPTDPPCNAMLETPFDWHSSPIDKQWVKFPPYRAMFMFLSDGAKKSFAGKAVDVFPYVASDEFGNDSVVAAGNLSVFKTCPGVTTGCIIITNETCAATYVRVSVHGIAPDTGDAASDAPVDSGDAGDQ